MPPETADSKLPDTLELAAVVAEMVCACSGPKAANAANATAPTQSEFSSDTMIHSNF
jgi:hypothetical protein